MTPPEKRYLPRVPGFDPAQWLPKVRSKLRPPVPPRTAQDKDASLWPTSGVQIFDRDTKEHVLTFVPLHVDSDLIEAVRAIPFQENYRTDGLKSRSVTFGYQPRIPLRRDYCAASALTYSHAKEHQVLVEYGLRTSRIFEQLLPREYAAQCAQISQCRPEWRVPNGHFTSGIVNDRNVLHYHRDAGNFPDSMSAMISLTRDMGSAGGKLIIPEYDLGLEFYGTELLIFNGAKYVHGVTPIARRTGNAYRYTIVYYALQAMCKCGTPQEELERVRVLKTQRAKKRTTANQAAHREELLRISGITAEEAAKLGERKKANFETKRGKR